MKAAKLPALSLLYLLPLVYQSVICTTVDVGSLSVGGVGSGVVAIIVFMVIGIVICVYGRCTPQPYVYAIIGTILPVIVGLIIWGLPKQASRVTSSEGETAPTSWIPILRWVFCIFAYLMAVVALLCLFLLFCVKSYEAYRVGADMSSMIIRESSGQFSNVKIDMATHRQKYFDKPEVAKADFKKSRAIVYPSNYQPDNEEEQHDEDVGWHRKRRDILQPPVEDEKMLGPEGDIRNTGKNKLRPRRLDPMRNLEMGIEIHTPPKRRRLNMIDPEDRTVKVEGIHVQGNRRMMDSDED